MRKTHSLKPSPQRRFINRQRFGAVKMAAGFLLRRAAGMKNGGALFRRNAGKLQFLERASRHGGNLRPMLDHFWRQSARLADFPVGGIVFKLKREQFQSEVRRKLPICRFAGLPIGNRRSPAQARGEAEKFFVHAVFVHGWFSATADGHDNTKRFRCKRDCLRRICRPDCSFDEQTVLHHHRD